MTKISGLHGQSVAIDLAAAPERGRANEHLLEWLAEAVGLPHRQLTLLRGHTSKDKTVSIVGLPHSELEARLLRLFPTS